MLIFELSAHSYDKHTCHSLTFKSIILNLSLYELGSPDCNPGRLGTNFLSPALAPHTWLKYISKLASTPAICVENKDYILCGLFAELFTEACWDFRYL